MVKKITILTCTELQMDILVDFAYELNNHVEHSSAFCSNSKSVIREDFSERISQNKLFACWNDVEITGLLSCYVDKPKNNADCSLLIDSRKCDYHTAAGMLFKKFKLLNDNNMKCTFFFPKENIECASFLESIHAVRQVNEYRLILGKRQAVVSPSNHAITELPGSYHAAFIELHDTIFPGVYISGADIIKDIGKGHFVYSIIEKGVLSAYSVLKLNEGRCATAEAVAVRENHRGKGYGRAILGYLIDQAYNLFNVEEIDLIVEGDNEKAIKLYSDMGFRIETENMCYIA